MNAAHGGNLFEISEQRGWDWRGVLDLSASINPLGPPPGVRAAVIDALDRIPHYPEKHSPRLCSRLARQWNVDPAQILCGNGATELIHFAARAWPHNEAHLVIPTFSEFHRAYPEAASSRFDTLPPTGLAVLTQPNNPTGAALAFECLREWALSREGPMLIDESFVEFSGLPSAVAFTALRPDLLVLRSLTKFYALPGLRVGALIGHPDLITRLRAVREPWQVNALAEAAALAALDDAEHAARTVQLIGAERIWLWKRLWKIPGVRPIHSSANFFLLMLDTPASDLCAWFLERQIILRDCTGWPGIEGEAVRFAIGERPQNERVAALLKEYLCSR
jgi:threonine-phosphate decarboxylase